MEPVDSASRWHQWSVKGDSGVLARVLDHLEAEIAVRPHFSRWRMINLEGLDLLAEIGGVHTDVDHIANA